MINSAHEVTDGVSRTYYSFGGQTILKDGDGLKYLLTDHLGSVVAITNASGTLISQQRYLPFGGERTNIGQISQTDYGYTGQRDLGQLGLMDYKARFYSPLLGRFTQPDTMIPDPANPQAWNRFSYVVNRPVNFNDPSGQVECEPGTDPCRPPGSTGTGSAKVRIGGGGGGGRQNNDDEEDSHGRGRRRFPVSDGDIGDSFSTSVDTGIPNLLEQFNYNITLPSILVYQGTIIFGDIRVTWTPSSTFNNGSKITLTPNGFRFGGFDFGSVSTNFLVNKDSFQFGYTSSLTDEANLFLRTNGSSISLPNSAQPWTVRITTHQSTRIGSVFSYNDAVTFEFTARPDRMQIVPAVFVIWALASKAFTGQMPSSKELLFGN